MEFTGRDYFNVYLIMCVVCGILIALEKTGISAKIKNRLNTLLGGEEMVPSKRCDGCGCIVPDDTALCKFCAETAKKKCGGCVYFTTHLGIGCSQYDNENTADSEVDCKTYIPARLV